MRPEHAPTLDGDLHRQVRRELGAEKTRDLLDLLAAQLRDEFTETLLTSSDRDSVAFQAHALIAATGMLGFTELARACIKLEAACLGAGDVEAAVAWARSTRQRALVAINGLEVD